MLFLGDTVGTCAKCQGIKTRIAAYEARCLTIANSELSQDALIVSYTNHGRQVTKRTVENADSMPALKRSLNEDYAQLRRCYCGGIPVSYGVPR